MLILPEFNILHKKKERKKLFVFESWEFFLNVIAQGDPYCF